MSEPAFDELLRRLVVGGVELVLVGGLAVCAWGVVRGTDDVDIVIDPDAENLRRIADLLSAAGGRVLQSESPAGDPPSFASALAVGKHVAIETDLGRLDVVHGFNGAPAFGELRSRAGEADLLGAKVPVCGLNDLREMKRAAGRPRDLADLEDLRWAHGG